MSEVRVLLFAAVRELVGAGELTRPVPTPTTAGGVLDGLCAEFPSLTHYRASLRIAVNGAYVRDDEPVRAGDEIAIIPPVAGG
jgi:molybdopterin converting factor subunit 1